MYSSFVRITPLIACLVALALVPACKKKRGADYVPIASVLPRAAKFEPIMAVIRKLPVSPPPVTRTFAPADALIGTGSTPGSDPTPEPYLVIHVEDLAKPPRYDGDKAVKVRLKGSQFLGVCADGLSEVKEAKEDDVYKTTLLPCTAFKYAYVVRETEYLEPTTKKVSDKTADKTRTIGLNHVPGRVSGDVTIYSLSDGKQVGAFQFRAVSSADPGTEGGIGSAQEADLKKQADEALRAACAAAARGGTTK